MLTVFVQGQLIEVNTTEYYLYWHRFLQMLGHLTGIFSYFPKTGIYKRGFGAFEDSLTFIQTNLDKFEDAELREQIVALIELLKPLPLAHQRMVDEITTQLKIHNPQSPYGKRQLTLKWRKLINGQASTEEMKQAIKSLQTYADWFIHRSEEITRITEQCQQRIENIYLEVKERLRQP
jgi:hypothetical protein